MIPLQKISAHGTITLGAGRRKKPKHFPPILSRNRGLYESVHGRSFRCDEFQVFKTQRGVEKEDRFLIPDPPRLD